MVPFLKQVAEHYFGEDLGRICFVFPNRRAGKFFVKYLSEVARNDAGTLEGRPPVRMPEIVTINDFFSKASGCKASDRITLLLELYDCYKALYPKAESLDEFIFWGDTLLGDFSDVDKYRVDAKDLFTNVSDFKSISDDFSHLTQSQREAIEAFLSHFDPSKKTEGVKQEFKGIWNILYPLYLSFNKSLSDKGLAYEGMVYRSLADKMSRGSCKDILVEKFPHAETFVFVGLNALNECEKKVLDTLRDAHLAEFCWDYSGDMIRNPLNKSSFFMESNVVRYPQVLTLDPEGLPLPEVSIVSVPSSIGQTKQVCSIIGEDDPSSCAVILPDENLLMPLLNSLDDKVEEVNVTMGYPMASSEFFAFCRIIHQLQLTSRDNGLYYKNVWALFSSGIFRELTLGSDKALRRIDEIRKARKYYIPYEDFLGGGLPELIFKRAVPSDLQGEKAVEALGEYLCSVATFVGESLCEAMEFQADDDVPTKNSDYTLEVDLAKEYYTCINRLLSHKLDLKLPTFIRLAEQLLSGINVAFNGEPLRGLQIMGPLETRALDFQKLIILSANEGVFPRKSIKPSFIPPELRKGFGLPTYEYQDAVWAYYFYRMISRARSVWMLYDSRTEGVVSGEESRYIKQLRYHFRLPIHSYVASAPIATPPVLMNSIPKTEEDVEAICSCRLSASSLKTYISCPAQFYYSKIKHLGKEEEVSESLDPSLFGNVYHEAMFALLAGDREMSRWGGIDKRNKPADLCVQSFVTKEYLEGYLERVDKIRWKVNSLICYELHCDEVTGRNLVSSDIIVSHVVKTIKADLKMMADAGVSKFEVLGLELQVDGKIFDQAFTGDIDRVDSLGSGNVRLVDYKTGKDDPMALVTSDDKLGKLIADIFNPTVKSSSKKVALLQFYIYDKLYSQRTNIPQVELLNSMYSTTKMEVLSPVSNSFSSQFFAFMDEELSFLLAQMRSLEEPFYRTTVLDHCQYCDFRTLCGR